MVSHKQLDYYSLQQLLDNNDIDYVIDIIDNIDHYPLDELICNLALFYKGSASFEYLEKQPITKLLILEREATRINARTTREINKANK